MSFIKAVRLEDDDPPPRPVQNVLPPASWQPTAYALAALNAECAQITAAGEGTRNDTLNRAAFNMAQLIAGGQIPEQQVMTALTHAGISVGLEAREIAKTIASGLRKGAYRSRTVTPRETGLAGPQEASSTELAQSLQDPMGGLNVLDWGALWAEDCDLEWILEPLIPAGRLIALYSPPKVGKSLLMLELCAAIAGGRPALGSPTRATRILYLDYENARGDVKSRLMNMGHTPEALGELLYASYPALPPLDTPEGGKALLAAAEASGAGLVTIDTISRAVQGEENDNPTWLNLYRHTLMPLKAAGIAVLRLDHTGKDEHKGQRGGSAKSGDVDAVWKLTEIVKGTNYRLECDIARIQIDEQFLNLTRQDEPLTHRVDTRITTEVKRQALLDLLDERQVPRDTGRDTIAAIAREAGLRFRNETLASIVRARRGLGPDDQPQD